MGNTIGTDQRGGEEVLQFKQAAWRADIFVAGHAADRAFVHFDLFGNVFQGHGFEEFDPEPGRTHPAVR